MPVVKKVKTVVRKKKVKSAPVEEPVAPANVEAVPEAAPETVVEPSVTESVPVTEDTPTEVTESAKDADAPVEETISSVFASIVSDVSAVQSQVKQVVQRIKALEKRVSKEQREARKRGRRKAVVDGDKQKRQPSGFAKPSAISEELTVFLGVEPGTLMARTEVTKKLNEYVKQNNLRNPKNQREIFPDTKLKALLKSKDGDEVTYFNLQRYMKHHFPKTSGDASTVATEVSA